MGGTWGWWLTARVALPEHAGERITKLRGVAHLTVQTRSESVEVPDITTAEHVERTMAGHKLMVKNVRARGETYTVTMTITRDPKKRGGWGEINLSSTFRMVDANGLPLSRRNYGGGRQVPVPSGVGPDPARYREIAEKLKGIAQQVSFDVERAKQLSALAQNFERFRAIVYGNDCFVE